MCGERQYGTAKNQGDKRRLTNLHRELFAGASEFPHYFIASGQDVLLLLLLT
jgi:hypothetical protein